MNQAKQCAMASVLAAASIAAAWTAPAQAGTVVYEDVGFLFAQPAAGEFGVASVGGTSEYVTKVNTFEIAAPGTYQAKLADFSFPESFSQLGLSISSFVDDQDALGRVFGNGSFLFNASSAGTYYASVLGVPGGTFGVGLYGVQVAEFAPAAVPLPPAVLFLVSGLAVFAAFGRGGKRLAPAGDGEVPTPQGALPA